MLIVPLALFTLVACVFSVFLSIAGIIFCNEKVNHLTILFWTLSCAIYILASIDQDKEIKELKSNLPPTNILENVER
jgi:hypothetical protein